MWDVKLSTVICVYVDIYVYNIIYNLFVKLTLSACVWRWSCTRYTGVDVVDAGGSGES